MSEKSPPQGAQAALRAVRLLKLFDSQQSEWTLAELASEAQLNKTTAHRLLQALHSEEMLARNTVTGQYRLGPATMSLGIQALSNGDLRRRARPLLARLSTETGETATLEVPVDDTMLILDEISGSHFVAAAGHVGTRWPMHATSTGKVLIAFEANGISRLASELSPLTANTITRRDDLEQQLADIRRRGFAETVDELEDGFSGVAAIVRGAMGDVLGALSICGPSQRLTSSRRASLGASLRAAAAQLQPGL